MEFQKGHSMNLKVKWKNFISDLFEIIKIMSEANIPVYASSAAFFIFLSMIPIMVLFFTVIKMIPSFDTYLSLYLVNAFSKEISDFLFTVIQKVLDSSPGILSISAVLILWSAGKGIQYLNRGLNTINKTKEDRFFLLQRVEGCVYTLLLIVVLILIITISIFGTMILNVVSYLLKVNLDWLTNIMHYRFLFEWIVISGLVCLVYAWLPRKKVKPHTRWRGALFTGVTITAFSTGFTFYIENIYSFTLYGSLATIIIVNVWIYFSTYLLLTGAVINRHADEKRQIRQNEKV